MSRPKLNAGPCSVDGCEKPAAKVRMCRMHYTRFQRHGTTDPRPLTDARVYIRSRTIPSENGCWHWAGSLEATGYARVKLGGGRRKDMAHRIAYEAFVGPIPAGLHIDHLCRNRACCNPDHLEPVTPRVNILRGESPSAVAARTGRCQRGHALSTRNWAGRTGKYCRECQNEARRSRRAAGRAAA